MTDVSDTATAPPPRRPMFCVACRQLDDHPKHTIGLPPDHPDAVVPQEFLDSLPDGAPVSAVATLINPRTIVRHLDCCAAAGCELCQTTEALTEGKRGQDLIDHLADDKANDGPVATLDTHGVKIAVSEIAGSNG